MPWYKLDKTNEQQPSPPLPLGEGPGVREAVFPQVPASRLTNEILTRVDAMLRSIAATTDISGTEQQIAADTGLAAGTQRRYKAELRQLFNLPPRSSLYALCSHPDIKRALAHVIIRKQPSNAGEMRSANLLSILIKDTGELVCIADPDSETDFLRSLYAHKNSNAKSCYLALVQACRENRVINEKTKQPATEAELPSLPSVRRFLREQYKKSRALRRSRMNRSERIADRVYISRPDDEYRPGGKLEGDHTEDVTMVYRNDGKAAPLWTTMLVDVRTGMIKGYVHSYYPNSNTIALAYRNAVLGVQVEVATTLSSSPFQGEDRGGVIPPQSEVVLYKPLGIIDAPDLIVYDNGKDYKSKYSNQVIGKVDFNDEARRTVQLISEIHHTGKRLPQAKGHVEGTFHIIQDTMLKYLPGYKGSNYSQKPDELSAQVRDGALLTEDQYKEIFKRVVNTINNRPRQVLGNLTPLQFYLANQQQVRVVDERVLDFLMMRIEHRNDKGCLIHRGYVTLFKEEYISMDLDGLNGKYCSLYYDPADLGRVAVYVRGQFVTIAVNKKLIGVTEREWLRIVKQRAQENKDVAEEIRAMRAGMTSEEAKAILFNAELNNIVPVKADLMQKKVPTILTLTGLEHEARNISEKLEVQKRIEDVQKKRDEKKPVRLIDTSKLR